MASQLPYSFIWRREFLCVAFFSFSFTCHIAKDDIELLTLFPPLKCVGVCLLDSPHSHFGCVLACLLFSVTYAFRNIYIYALQKLIILISVCFFLSIMMFKLWKVGLHRFSVLAFNCSSRAWDRGIICLQPMWKA